MASYEKQTVHSLKLKLYERGASTRGRKADLIQRLEAYDRNQNFGPVSISLPEPTIVNWPECGFKQLRTEHLTVVPQFHKSVIEGYFLYQQVCDGQGAKDLKAIEKGRSLLQAKNVDVVSMFKDENCTYFTSIVRAAMKKKVSYNLKIKVDLIGEVMATHCECPSGTGPHGTCKHIAAVLLMMVDFCKTGKLPLRGSCTDALQTFHKPKKIHNGSPVKAENLGVLRKRGQCSSLTDPRPHQYRNVPGYRDMVRSNVINYCGNYGEDLTIRFLYGRANLQAAAQDHDYCALPWTEYRVDDANEVTKEEARKIEEMTREQAKSVVWHSQRAWRITASRFGDILKSTERRDMDKLCRSLVDTKDLHTPATSHGKKYESVAVQQFESLRHVQVEKCGLFVNEEFPFLAATPDGLVGSDAVIEVKCPYTGRHSKISNTTEFPYLEPSAAGLQLKRNHNHYFQIQGQLLITKRLYCHFIVYTFEDMYIEIINADVEFGKLSMLPRLQLFYEKHFRKHVADKL